MTTMQIVIPLITALGGFLIAAVTLGRNRDKDIRQEAANSAVIATKLDTISTGVDSIRIDMRASEKTINNLSERMVRVEESTKQSHKRLDDLVAKGGEKDES